MMDIRHMVKSRTDYQTARRLFRQEIDALKLRVRFFDHFGAYLEPDQIRRVDSTTWEATVVSTPIKFKFKSGHFDWMWLEIDDDAEWVEDPSAADLIDLIDSANG